MQQIENLKTNCIHFQGDRPCKFHKQSGVLCPCSNYQPVSYKILLIKVGNLGDVLRTTSILSRLKRSKRAEGVQLTWLVDPKGYDLLKNNPLIDRIYFYRYPDIETVKVEEFDEVICLDKDKDIVCLAQQIPTRKILGWQFDSNRGIIFPANVNSDADYLMGVDDDMKKKNTKSAQYHYAKMVGIDSPEEYYLELPSDVRPFNKVKVCLNWMFDKETFATREWFYWKDLECLLQERGISFSVQKKFDSLDEYIMWIDSGDVVVSIDSLGLHIGIALGKKVIGLFGSTGYPEIDMYGRGVKLIAHDLDCILCRKQTCGSMRCMREIKPEMVMKKIIQGLDL